MGLEVLDYRSIMGTKRPFECINTANKTVPKMYGTTTAPKGDVFQSKFTNCLRCWLLLLTTRLTLTYALVSIDMVEIIVDKGAIKLLL
jgi:hypothetical protein